MSGMPLLEGVAVRWALYAGLLGVLGAVALRVVLGGVRTTGASWRDTLFPEMAARTARLGAWAALLVLVAALLRLPLQLAEMRMPGEPFDPALVRTLVLDTGWGRGWLLQLGGAAAAALAFRAARGGSAAAWAGAGIAAGALAVSPALAGHGASGEGALALLTAASHVGHVLGAGLWLGTLAALAAVALPAALAHPAAERGPLLRALLSRFSPLALAAAGLLVLSGVAATALHLDAPASLWRTAYGRTLLAKVALVFGVIALGAWNWRRATPALRVAPATTEERDDAAGRFQRSAHAELVLGALALLVTAALVVQPLPGGE